MSKETDLLEGMLILAKKYGYTVSDVMIDNPRVEFGLMKNEAAPDEHWSLTEEE